MPIKNLPQMNDESTSLPELCIAELAFDFPFIRVLVKKVNFKVCLYLKSGTAFKLGANKRSLLALLVAILDVILKLSLGFESVLANLADEIAAMGLVMHLILANRVELLLAQMTH